MVQASDFRRFGLDFTGTRPALRLGEPGIDARWLRRFLLGGVVGVGWFGLVPILLAIGFIAAWGPFGRVDTWQLDTFGSNNVILLVILFMPLAFVPQGVARLVRVDASRPLLFGMRQSFDDRWGPRVEDGVDPGARLRTRIRRAQGFAAAGAAVVAFFTWKGFHDAATPHAPLPVLSYARLVDPAVPLVGALRLTGAVADPSKAWTHAYTVRQDAHRDVYYPLRPAGGPADEPASLIELDQTNPDRGERPWNRVDPPGPREGSPALLDDWTAGQLRRAGVALAPRVIVLTRRRLGGRDPDPDPLKDYVHGVLGFSVMFGGLVYWWKLRRAGKLLERQTGNGSV